MERTARMFSLSFQKEGQEGHRGEGHLDEDGEGSKELTFSIIRIVIIENRHPSQPYSIIR